MEEGIITPQQLAQAQDEERRTGVRFRKIIMKMGLIDEQDLVSLLSNKLGIPKIELQNYVIDPKVAELIPEQLARKYDLIPVLKIGNRLMCAMADPWNVFALDELRMKTHMTIEQAVATEGEIRKAIDEHYGIKGSIRDIVEEEKRKHSVAAPSGPAVKSQDDLKVAEEPAVIKLANLIMMQAVREGASDIHIEPEEDRLRIRFRIDGRLHEVESPPKHLQSAVISRIKILANLDIAERRVPQDGRFNLKMEGREIDIRVSSMPTMYGENVVMRLLDVSGALLPLSQLGFAKEMLEKYEKLITRPYGILLVTGPTGSGKTTTLYSSLAKINTAEKNIITIEDPIEYRLAGIRQTQVNAKVKLTFSNGLRSILRQDPDIIMVGEIRDLETAEIAIQAALTGHLVFSTLHTNDAPGAITRMTDMGVESFLISSSLVGVLAQRLVRTVCKECKEEYVPTAEALRDIGMDGKGGAKFFRGKGCAKCRKTGYKGRIGVYELMIPDDNIRRLTVAKTPLDEMRKQAKSSGMVSLKDDGIRKIREGLTTIEEVLRVCEEEKH